MEGIGVRRSLAAEEATASGFRDALGDVAGLAWAKARLRRGWWALAFDVVFF